MIDPGEVLDPFDDIWRPEEQEQPHVERPKREDIWGEKAPPHESLFVLPRTWRASAPPKPRRRLWIALGILSFVGIAAAIVLLLIRMP